MSKELESAGLEKPSNAEYGVVGQQTDRVVLSFTNIQGQGYAQVWLRQGRITKKLDTISLFDTSNFSQLLLFSFEAEDEIGVNLVSSSDTPFRATLDVTIPAAVGGGDEDTVINLTVRVARLEELITEGGGELPGDAGARLGVLESGFSALRTDVDAVESSLTAQINKESTDVQNLTNLINTKNTEVNTRIDNLSSSGGGSSISNVIQTITASVGSSTKTLDAALADRYDIIGDASNTYNITNVTNTGNQERILTVAAMSTKRGTNRLYNAVRWLTGDGSLPPTEQRPGFGELIYITNIHGGLFGQYRSGVQFKYFYPNPPSVLSNYPLVESVGPVKSLVGDRTATFENFTPDPEGGFIAGQPINGYGAIFEDLKDSRQIKAFSIWFTLASLSGTGGAQKLWTIMESSNNLLSLSLEEYEGNLRVRTRNPSGELTDVTINTMPLTINVPYVATVNTNPTSGSQTCTVYLKRLDTGVEISYTIPNWAFLDRRNELSKYYIAAGTDKRINLRPGGKIRAWVTFNTLISVGNKDALHGGYL